MLSKPCRIWEHFGTCCRNHVAFDGILEHVVETMSHLTAFWVPLGYLGGALGCTGRFSQICRKLDAQFRANVSILQCLRIESSLPELSRQSPGSPGSGIWTAARCPPSSRRGPGWREFKGNSLKTCWSPETLHFEHFAYFIMNVANITIICFVAGVKYLLWSLRPFLVYYFN